MSLEGEQYERIHSILSVARELRGDDLERYLDAECGDDAALRARILELIDAGRDEEAPDAFSTRALEEARAGLEGVLAPPRPDWLPERIGDYTVRRQIGRGGMGVVYEAEQASPARRVAIKLLHPLDATPERLRRLEREVALLGRLQHPGIAQIYEAATYDVGRGSQPFFAMELVDGVDIRTFCERSGLDARQRLELLAAVADAVQYAHERGVIHRDLKPDNVLVDERGRPRILDFGIAHANKRSTDLSSLRTADGQLMGTLAYMAPEQLSDDAHEVSPRVDVFALGVLGFELLLGRLPREIADLPLPQAIALLAREEPLRAGQLDTRFRGDVETILGKALEAEPSRRYASAAAFGADIRRYLDNQPIHAHPPSTVYLIGKFVRRHRALVAGTLATLTVALLGAFVATHYAFDAMERASELEQKSNDILRLSLLQDYEDLMRRERELWPAHPRLESELSSWIDDAGEVIAELPSLTAKRDELRALALPQTPEELVAQRESHPEYVSLEKLRGALLMRQRAVAKRHRGESITLPTVDWEELPTSVSGLLAVARPLVHPARTVFGREPYGLVLARKALEVAAPEERWNCAMTVALALFAIGHDEECLAQMKAMLPESPSPAARAGRERAIAALERSIEAANTEEGLASQEARLAELEAEVATLEERVNERREWKSFPPELELESRPRWWLNQLDGLIARLEPMTGAESLLSADGVSIDHGWSVPRRLESARRLKEAFAEGGEYARRWDEAFPEIFDAYPRLEMDVQMGLVPIGADPDSGLWEFWHVQSGAEPIRGEDGRLVLDEGSGLVFVLLPKAMYRMGAQTRPEQWNDDPDAQPDEGPIHEVYLSAFFLSKYEMTQAQWERSAGGNPSRWTEGSIGRSWVEGAHPVEQVSWEQSVDLLRTLDLALPSEAQWEYACRAGSDAPRPFPEDRIAAHANLADQSYGRQFKEATAFESWSDGLGAHGPVGSLEPNAFGLHDMIGNVAEWCLDAYLPTFYSGSPPVDPVAPSVPGEGSRVIRGGGCMTSAALARSGARAQAAPSVEELGVGVRPARAVKR